MGRRSPTYTSRIGAAANHGKGRSRPARMALALFGLVGAGVLGVILGVVREAGWLSLIRRLRRRSMECRTLARSGRDSCAPSGDQR
jgi:hypothetical protein